MATYDVNKLTKLNALKQLAEKVKSIYATKTEVDASIKTAIAESGHASFETAAKKPTASEAKDNVLYLVMNDKTQHYDIYAKVGNEVVLLDDTTVDLTNYVEKEDGAGLYPDEDKEKLAGIASGANFYEHPESAAGAKDAGIYKITTDKDGHIIAAEAITKEDITKLGIPDKDTTYEVVTTTTDGLMSHQDKEKFDGMEVASDEDVQAMLEEVFSA